MDVAEPADGTARVGERLFGSLHKGDDSAWESATLEILKGDPDVSATVTALASARELQVLLGRIRGTARRRELLQILGARLNAEAKALVEPCVRALGAEWELQFNLGRLAMSSAAEPFDAAAYSFLISPSPAAPFTGSGATGTSEWTLSIPILDRFLLAIRHGPTRAWYSNPLDSSPAYAGPRAYLATLTPLHRVQQARLLLRTPINSVMSESYAGNIPSRAQVVRAAAQAHNLQPEMVAAILLAEQRNQSRNEDAAEYLAATSILRANTSIGLGQVRVWGVRLFDLFADLLSVRTRQNLSHKQIARLLVSEEFNIFAVARYIRRVADSGSRINEWSLPNTLASFPAIGMAEYAKNSSAWSEDNIRALASKYTSTPWEDIPVKGWADFVIEAYHDVVASACFGTAHEKRVRPNVILPAS
jgi:hypothetical protein